MSPAMLASSAPVHHEVDAHAVASSQQHPHHHQQDQVGVNASKPLEGEELTAALLKQLEFYFTRENLASDVFLASNMNQERYVPIDVVAGFKAVKALTEDVSLIVSVLKTSKQVTVDPTGKLVKPNITVQRSTIILRDIAADVPEEEIRKIFEGNECAPIKSLRSDIGNTWFVTFETEEQATETLLVIRSRKFRDAKISAGIKSESILKSGFGPSRSSSNGSTAPSSATTSPGSYGNMNAVAALGYNNAYDYQADAYYPAYYYQQYYDPSLEYQYYKNRSSNGPLANNPNNSNTDRRRSQGQQQQQPGSVNGDVSSAQQQQRSNHYRQPQQQQQTANGGISTENDVQKSKYNAGARQQSQQQPQQLPAAPTNANKAHSKPQHSSASGASTGPRAPRYSNQAGGSSSSTGTTSQQQQQQQQQGSSSVSSSQQGGSRYNSTAPKRKGNNGTSSTSAPRAPAQAAPIGLDAFPPLAGAVLGQVTSVSTPVPQLSYSSVANIEPKASVAPVAAVDIAPSAEVAVASAASANTVTSTANKETGNNKSPTSTKTGNKSASASSASASAVKSPKTSRKGGEKATAVDISASVPAVTEDVAAAATEVDPSKPLSYAQILKTKAKPAAPSFPSVTAPSVEPVVIAVAETTETDESAEAN